MPQRQLEVITAALADIYGAPNESGMLCCTLEAVNAGGSDVSIQVMADSISISPYPYAEEPLTRLELNGALETLEDMDLELVDWDANAFATVGTAGNEPADVARLVDETFTKVLGCDASYAPRASTEDLG
ncbi:MAG: hypothetical protein EBY18_19885 [Alphaproteobacteria bacterium]|nr:hypothetical protein [Alphaproteobacteria bacterium]